MTLMWMVILPVPVLHFDQSYPISTLEIVGSLDLAGLIAAIWTLWSSAALPLGGHLRHAFRWIGFGALAFAAAHLVDSLILAFQILDFGQIVVVEQVAVLASMFVFVPGLAGLADALPALGQNRLRSFPQLWPIAISLSMAIGALSFILYGISPAAETLALIGLDGSLIFITLFCLLLLLWAQIGGTVGHSLWTALFGLLLFSLAHPSLVILYEHTNSTPGTLSLLHRLIVMPAFFLFAISISSLAHTLRQKIVLELRPPAGQQEQQERSTSDATSIPPLETLSPRARAVRHTRPHP